MSMAKTCPECGEDIDRAPLVVGSCSECHRRREVDVFQPYWIREAAACVEWGETPLNCRLNMNAMRSYVMSERDGYQVARVALDAYQDAFHGTAHWEDAWRRAEHALESARAAVIKSGIRPERIERR